MYFNNFKRPLFIITSILIAIGAIYLVRVSWFSKKKNEDEKVLTIALIGRVDATDPAQLDRRYPLQVVCNIAEPLLVYDYTADGQQLVPNLLKTMPSVSTDGLTYTFELKPGIYFQNHPRLKGKKRELTAEEVVFSLTRHVKKGAHYYELFKPVKGSEAFHKGVATHVAGIKKLDKYTFQIVLKNPYPSFLYILAMPPMCMIAPESIGNGQKEDFYLIGTGPYIIKRMTPNQIELEKSPGYRVEYFPKVKSEKFAYMKNSEGKQLPFIDKIIFKVITEATTQLSLLKTGDVDLMPALAIDQINDVLDKKKQLKSDLKQKGFQVFAIPNLGVRGLPVNFSHPVLRQYPFLHKVFARLFDVEYALHQIAHGHGSLAKGIIPPGISGYDPDLKNPYAYDVKKAQEILERNGCKLKKDSWYKGDKKLPTIVLTIVKDQDWQAKLAELLKNSLQKLHLTLEIKLISWDELMGQIKIPGNNMMIYPFGWGLDRPTPLDTLQLFYSKNIGSSSVGHYSNATFDRWFEKSQKLDTNSEECIALFKKMNKKIYTDGAWIPLWTQHEYSMYYVYLKNYRTSDLIMYNGVKYMDIDLAEKARFNSL